MKLGFAIILIFNISFFGCIRAQEVKWHSVHIDELDFRKPLKNSSVFNEKGEVLPWTEEKVVVFIEPFEFHYNKISGEVCLTGTVEAKVWGFDDWFDLFSIFNVQGATITHDSIRVNGSVSSCSENHLFECWLYKNDHTHLVVSDSEGLIIAVYSLDEIFKDRFNTVLEESYLQDELVFTPVDTYRANLNGKYAGDGVISWYTLQATQGLYIEKQGSDPEIAHYRITLRYKDKSTEIFHQFNKEINFDLKRTLNVRIREMESIRVDQIIVVSEDLYFQLSPLDLRIVD